MTIKVMDQSWSRDLSWETLSLALDSSRNQILCEVILLSWAFLVAQLVKNMPATWETWVQSLGWEDLLEESMATHSSILAWRIPMDRRA